MDGARDLGSIDENLQPTWFKARRHIIDDPFGARGVRLGPWTLN